MTVRAAEPLERTAALQLAFQHLDDPEQHFKIRTALGMIERGEFDPDGLIVAVDGTGIAGCIMAMAMQGGAIVWPPRCRRSLANSSIVEDLIVEYTNLWLTRRGARIAQTMLLPEEEADGAALVRHGFQPITRLMYLRHFLDLAAEELAKPERLTYRTANELTDTELESLVDRTYIESADCPELNHTRGAADFLAGHRAASEYNPNRWWIAHHQGQPVGVVLMNQTETDTWDMAYLGVVFEARKRGIGRELVRKALFEAKAAGMLMVTLALDHRNEPARRLYHQAGFEPFDERIVLLKAL